MSTNEKLSAMADHIVQLAEAGELSKFEELLLLQGIDKLLLIDRLLQNFNEKTDEIISNL